MAIAYIAIGTLLIALAFTQQARERGGHGEVAGDALRQLQPMLLRLPLALLAGSFLGQLVPQEHIVALLGEASGLRGIFIASLLGALLPGGPMVSFPIAIALHTAGMGMPQMVALITSWAVLALHRVLVFELPMLGWGFVYRRLLVSLVIPVAAGILASAVLLWV